jgi:hypothetical protein
MYPSQAFLMVGQLASLSSNPSILGIDTVQGLGFPIFFGIPENHSRVPADIILQYFEPSSSQTTKFSPMEAA